MTEVPTSPWSHGFDEASALDDAPRLSSDPAWRRVPGIVSHVFTHFPLELAVYRTQVRDGTRAPDGARWVPVADLPDEALPSVMRKVLAHALNGTQDAKKPARKK